MASSIPLGDLTREYSRIRSEIDSAIERVLQKGWFVLGPEGEAFEREWAGYCQAAHAVGVGNGTDALYLTLRAAGVGPGDEVVLPAFTAAFTALAVSMTGATPVFADIDLTRYTLDPAALEASISPRTVAVVPVHIFGCPADMAAIVEIARQHDLLVFEDAAQAHGARYQDQLVGGLGKAAVFGFYPSMNLGAYGDAGIIVTNDAALAERARMLRHGGQRSRYEHELLGANSRLDEIQAAILRAKLPYLDGWNKRRRALARRYRAGLSGVGDLSLPEDPQDVEHVYHFYVVRTEMRDALRDYLYGAGVNTGIHYPRGVHLQEAFAHLGYEQGSCPNTEQAASQVLSLPVFPQLSTHEVDQVVRMIRFFFAMH